MDDGGMGSLSLKCKGCDETRSSGIKAAEYEFVDRDGVPVVATLYLDERGALRSLMFGR